MRSLSIVVLAGLILAGSIAMADEEAAQEKMARFSLSFDPGYLWLTGNDQDVLDNGAAYGLTAGYRLTKEVQATLPFLMSFHSGKDLPDGEESKLSIYSLTPGLTFSSGGKLDCWFFLGGGVVFVHSKMELMNATATETDTDFGARVGVGINYAIRKKISIGVNGAVLTASGEEMQPSGLKEWDTSFFYAALGEVKYTF